MTAALFDFFDLHVLRAQRISPGFARVTLGGECADRLASGGRDQRVKLFLPRPGQREASLPRGAGDRWWPAWQRMDPATRAVMRTYTVREQRPGELDLDFAIHGDVGHACRWARRVRPGDPATLLGPLTEDNAGVGFRPPADTAWVLLAGDATALPAMAGILAWLPEGMPVKAWIEVAHGADRQALPTKADADVTWLCRDGLPPGQGDPLLRAVRAAALPQGTPYAWLAGEAGCVRALRRHLVGDRGFRRDRITFTGYWRRGVSEDHLIEEAIAAAS
ncbi:siderophore-interacting protein [Streptomyces sp. 7-21]|jgi:NADPH-dependent ferric siderophore reductase|uniref:siderophore-interacting protein n=1 Tax=Streptomyces sp. 7-21 TaxID=2802283 RepID=UPI00191DA853|nr:siderophore-interacting protein [Streptomyces sp. 7-21]MBL1068895.1 siderophore-interacting protein [Streptomyces sp. 7-21]